VPPDWCVRGNGKGSEFSGRKRTLKCNGMYND
jgi:hypothetical protein